MRDFFPFMHEKKKKELVDNQIQLTVEELQEQLPLPKQEEEKEEGTIIIDILDQ
jgi:hypothetical protein